jgi:putative membrane protein
MLRCAMRNTNPLLRFLLFWALNTLVLWVASQIFSSMRFDSAQTLIVSGLVFGLINATLKPIMVIVTLPITLLTLGLFLLVINALILMLTAWLVPGFHLAGFGNALLISIFVSVFSFILNLMLGLKK